MEPHHREMLSLLLLLLTPALPTLRWPPPSLPLPVPLPAPLCSGLLKTSTG